MIIITQNLCLHESKDHSHRASKLMFLDQRVLENNWV